MRGRTRLFGIPVQACVAGALALAVSLLTVPAVAIELRHLEIRTDKGSYDLEMTLSIVAPPTRVIAVLTDYSYPDKLNPDVTGRTVLNNENGLTRVRTEFRGCAVFFCRDLTLVQDVVVTANTVAADVVPGEGDFTAGRLEWHITANDAGGSDIEFRANMEYEFFVVPLFGRLLLRNRLRHQLLATAEKLETEAFRQID